MYGNLSLLNQMILDSGLKKEYIANVLGISDQALRNKLKGVTEFTNSEVGRLINVLNISESQVMELFHEMA